MILNSFYALGVILCTVLIQTSAADLFTIATAKASDDKPIANDKLKAELLALFKKSDELSLEQTFAMWNYDSDLSKKNAEAQHLVSMEIIALRKSIHEKLKNISCNTFDEIVPYVQCRMFNNLGLAALPTEKYTEYSSVLSDMQKLFATAKLCPYNASASNDTKCNLDFDPTVINIMATSRDPKELAYYWQEFRNKTGKLMRKKYAKYVQILNEGVRLSHYKDAGDSWIALYNQPHFKETIEKLWTDIKPLYVELHAYVRRKLLAKYGPEVVFEKEPIPAHLLGNMWAQSWSNIYDITQPYPDIQEPDITKELQRQNYTVLKMFKKAEDFFLSLNMSKMTTDFWENSVFVRPKDRDIVCHGSAWDFHDGKTYRIKLCALVGEDDLTTIHHEMGHIEYDMMYSQQLPFYQTSPNPGFHEAVGDTIVLSVKTHKHLKRIGLLKEDFKDDPESTINELFKFGLERLTFPPFGYLTDLWRWSVFNGSIPEDQYETAWWKLREEYQGVQPPMPRSEDDFDPGSKYHIPNNVEYLRYFVSYISQFQFHKAVTKFESQEFDTQYLGTYANQLKIGIWGGDVVLKNLILKQSALDELNLPIRTIYGQLGQLTLKIPWKNLYAAPVEASVDSLYLLAVPNQDVKYDPAKEEQWAQDAKQKEINKVELAKQQEKEKEEGKEKAQDSFVEKLATQIIRNVQVFIKKIHIRYEDRITNPRQPFAAGITLYNLTVHTTDDKWTHYISSGQETSSMIYKMLNLEAASVYWNTDTKLFTEKDTSQLEELFLHGIADKARMAPHYQYIIGPINAVSRLRINTKPETDFSLPKITLELDLERLQVRLSKDQYKDLIRLVDSLNHMSKASMYRKYRPNLDVYQGFAKEWWHFAYRCILEEQVRRRRRNWEWSHMREHRTHVHAYEKAWRAKLTTAKPSAQLLASLEACERYLDAMNIILVRQKIENAVAREAHLQTQLKANENKGWLGGWLGGWGGGVSNQARETKKNELVSQFEEAMTAKEKEKLYKAIGYQETALPAVYPESFIEAKCSFVMHCLEIEIRDEELSSPRVLILVLKQMKADLEKKPVSQALRVATSVEVLSVFGLAQGDKVPQLITSKRSKDDGEGTLLDVLFEINPSCRTCDQRIYVNAKPLQVVYDARTLIHVTSIFTPDQSEADVMYQLQEAAATKMIEFKEMSALGLQNAITNH
ncbi:vacuolar protein sorting-associated protein 13 [Diaphorina citri]|uniref:Angiotensin-converting enzyme n=1 Tax=Diaphorina citri TaxID=121845 RepID=A0A3Q0IN20_DIACI|nr:vacuolar protein sorting-associated protein 13 [Diaphorina citri]